MTIEQRRDHDREKAFGLYLPEHLWVRVRAVAEKHGIKVQEIYKQALEEEVARGRSSVSR